MSGLVFAGSAQFVVLALWAPALPILAIASATVIVNLRYVLMAAVLRDLFRDATRITIFLLCDESWALTMAEKAQGRGSISFLAGSGIVVYLAWISSTIAGRLIGEAIGDPTKWGVDFAFTATFLALLVGMSRGRSDILPWSVAAVVATPLARRASRTRGRRYHGIDDVGNSKPLSCNREWGSLGLLRAQLATALNRHREAP